MSAELAETGTSIRRALRLLESLSTTGPARPLDDLAAATGLSKSTAYRLLRVLQDECYVERGETGDGYRLGSRLVGLAAAALPQMDLYTAARPILASLARASGETATLHVRSGDLSILVLAVESREHTLRMVATIGEATPIYRGAAGLALIAGMQPDEQRRIITRYALPAGRAALAERIAEVSRRGYSVTGSENHSGLNGIATVITATAGSSVAACVAVSGPDIRFTFDRMAEFSPQLQRAATELSALFAAHAMPAAAVSTASH